jgi:hypothetical protein
LTEEILRFLREIGIAVRLEGVAEPTFLPGISIDSGALKVDLARLKYPGDLLHEAGHLALMEPAQRAAARGDAGDDPGYEMGAIAWSYAAAVHLGIDPRVVFHEDGYRRGSRAILDALTSGACIGTPMLHWLGLALDEPDARARGLKPYPYMLRWLRE